MNTPSKDIKIVRLYDFPVKTVWEAWTDVAQTAQWWGPRGFALTNHSKELKVGGIWHYTMHGPDGVDYPNKTKYFEVEKYARLVYDHGGNDEQAPMFRVTVNFKEENGKTHMDMTMTLPTPEAAEQTKVFIKKAGGGATWDRLAEFLAAKINQQEVFVMNRSFETSVEKLFEMWTNSKHFSKWMGPAGSQLDFKRADLKAGGSSFYSMAVGPGMLWYGKANYLEIESPKRLIYTQQFCDENEKVIRHPMAKTWPETMLTTVIFTEEGQQQSRLTLTWIPYGSTTPEEMATFTSARAGMGQGWTGSFDQLEAYLRTT